MWILKKISSVLICWAWVAVLALSWCHALRQVSFADVLQMKWDLSSAFSYLGRNETTKETWYIWAIPVYRKQRWARWTRIRRGYVRWTRTQNNIGMGRAHDTTIFFFQRALFRRWHVRWTRREARQLMISLSMLDGNLLLEGRRLRALKGCSVYRQRWCLAIRRPREEICGVRASEFLRIVLRWMLITVVVVVRRQNVLNAGQVLSIAGSQFFMINESNERDIRRIARKSQWWG